MRRIVLALVAIAAIMLPQVSFANCPAISQPGITSTIIFAPGQIPEIKEVVKNPNGFQETWTVVVDVFTWSGAHIQHQQKTLTFAAFQARTVMFQQNFPFNGTFYAQVGIYDTNGCQRFNRAKINIVNIAGPTRVCGSSCTIQLQ